MTRAGFGKYLTSGSLSVFLIMFWISWLFCLTSVGDHNGSVNGIQYFSCPQSYGAFVPVDDILCITSFQVSCFSWKDIFILLGWGGVYLDSILPHKWVVSSEGSVISSSTTWGEKRTSIICSILPSGCLSCENKFFIDMQMKTNFNKKGWVPGLASNKRPKAIRKGPVKPQE